MSRDKLRVRRNPWRSAAFHCIVLVLASGVLPASAQRVSRVSSIGVAPAGPAPVVPATVNGQGGVHDLTSPSLIPSGISSLPTSRLPSQGVSVKIGENQTLESRKGRTERLQAAPIALESGPGIVQGGTAGEPTAAAGAIEELAGRLDESRDVGKTSSLLSAFFDGDWRKAGNGVSRFVYKRDPGEGGSEASPTEDAVRTSRPDFQPHKKEPYAILPDGSALPPDSYVGGFHGTGISPEEVLRDRGFAARGPYEDWRLQEHAEQHSNPRSAFRGTTPFISLPGEIPAGAAYWADKGGWVYEFKGVPTWDVNSDLEGRIQGPGGHFRGNRMSAEAEFAVPAQIPRECITGWGQVEESSGGKPYVPRSGWVVNPFYDAVMCSKFWRGS